eukprot:gene7075-7288_t
MHTIIWIVLVAVGVAVANAENTNFPASEDDPQQRAALVDLFNAVGSKSDLAAADATLGAIGYPGTSPWLAPNVSYCWWWGVSCCGHTLAEELQICEHGTSVAEREHSVSALELPAVGLAGTLPDLFDKLPDLQVLDLSHNRGLQGQLPSSLGRLRHLWQLNIQGTAMSCNGTAAQQAACPLPDWLMQTLNYYYDHSGLECPTITFRQPRAVEERLAKVYRGAALPEGLRVQGQEVLAAWGFWGDLVSRWAASQEMFGGFGGCEGRVLVIVILVPSLAVSVGLVLLSVALMRYLRYLKRSHDAIHLTEAWKRRNPPGIISDGNDRVLREVTLVMTDVEGSTELWEWDLTVMTLAQEVHDSVMRSLIGSLAMQQAMLEAEWPDALLRHDKAKVVYSTSEDSSRPGQLLFRGLRVRVAISTGIPSMVYTHELTNTLMYAGPATDLLTVLSDLPTGGQLGYGRCQRAAGLRAASWKHQETVLGQRGSSIMPAAVTIEGVTKGVRLTQIITRQLSPRAAHFPPLATPRQIYPSFFQAPSASEALLPDGLRFKSRSLPIVTMAFCAPADTRSLEAASSRAAKQAQEMFCSAVRTTLSACGGYECQEKDGIFMLAFDDPGMTLCHVLHSPSGREVYGPQGELLYRGIRARVGIYKGDVTRIIPHRATGRADYFGPPVNRAARFLAASKPGQILAERTLVEDCILLWQQQGRSHQGLAGFGSVAVPVL